MTLPPELRRLCRGRGGDDGGAVEALGSVGEVEGVETVEVGGGVAGGEFGFGDDVESAGVAIDDGSADDAGFGGGIAAVEVVAGGDGGSLLATS